MSPQALRVREFCDLEQAQELLRAVRSAAPSKVRKGMHSFTILVEDGEGELIASVKSYKERGGWDLEALGVCAVSSFGGLRP